MGKTEETYDAVVQASVRSTAASAPPTLLLPPCSGDIPAAISVVREVWTREVEPERRQLLSKVQLRYDECGARFCICTLSKEGTSPTMSSSVSSRILQIYTPLAHQITATAVPPALIKFTALLLRILRPATLSTTSSSSFFSLEWTIRFLWIEYSDSCTVAPKSESTCAPHQLPPSPPHGLLTRLPTNPLHPPTPMTSDHQLSPHGPTSCEPHAVFSIHSESAAVPPTSNPPARLRARP